VLDIGSNSVRLVVYERHARSLTPLYNEKSACALGRGIAQSGRLADANVAKALDAIKRFALVARMMRVGKHPCAGHLRCARGQQSATNSSLRSKAIMETRVRMLSGEEEAHFAALGVVAGIPGLCRRGRGSGWGQPRILNHYQWPRYQRAIVRTRVSFGCRTMPMGPQKGCAHRCVRNWQEIAAPTHRARGAALRP
jgi:hypothetical protein